MKMLRTIAIISATTMLSTTAYAQDMRGACKDDVQTYCNGVQPGGGRIINCLMDHYKDVSDNCYSVLQKLEARRGQGDNNSAQGGLPVPPPPQGNNGGSPMPPQGGNDMMPPPPQGGNDMPPPPQNGDGQPPMPPMGGSPDQGQN